MVGEIATSKIFDPLLSDLEQPAKKSMDAIHALKKRAVHSCKDLVGFIILLLEKGWDGGVGGDDFKFGDRTLPKIIYLMRSVKRDPDKISA